MQFEEKYVTTLQRLEIHLAPWPPEIYLIWLSRSEKAEPLIIGDSHEELHSVASVRRRPSEKRQFIGISSTVPAPNARLVQAFLSYRIVSPRPLAVRFNWSATSAGDATRRKAFYSYATAASGIAIDLALSSTDVDRLSKGDITVSITAPGRAEEVESWKDVFGIEERYKAKCCAKNDGKYWLVQALDECINAGKTSFEILQNIERNAVASPWAEANFLKEAFLRACHQANLI